MPPHVIPAKAGIQLFLFLFFSFVIPAKAGIHSFSVLSFLLIFLFVFFAFFRGKFSVLFLVFHELQWFIWTMDKIKRKA